MKNKKATTLPPKGEEKYINDVINELTQNIDKQILEDIFKQDKLDRLEKLRKKL